MKTYYQFVFEKSIFNSNNFNNFTANDLTLYNVDKMKRIIINNYLKNNKLVGFSNISLDLLNNNFEIIDYTDLRFKSAKDFFIDKNVDITNIKCILVPSIFFGGIYNIGKAPFSESYTEHKPTWFMMTSEWIDSEYEKEIGWQIHEFGHCLKGNGIKNFDLAAYYKKYNITELYYPANCDEYVSFLYQTLWMKDVKKYNKEKIVDTYKKAYTIKFMGFENTGWDEHKEKIFSILAELVYDDIELNKII